MRETVRFTDVFIAFCHNYYNIIIKMRLIISYIIVQGEIYDRG